MFDPNSKLGKLFARFITQQSFVFRSLYYEKSVQVSDTDVVQYEFINQGNTVVDINGILLQPSASGLEPVRWSGPIQSNENDATVYKLKFIPASTKVCSGSVVDASFLPCAPPASCNYGLKITISGVLIGIGINCAMSQAEVQAAIDAALVAMGKSDWVGLIIVTFDADGLEVTATDVTVPVGSDGMMILDGSAFGECPDIIGESTMTCEMPDNYNKLLVISKCRANARLKVID